ncbi:glycosyltransferase family 4 protein [Patescibacteria group bacterium]
MRIAQIVCRFKPYKGGISNMAYDHALGLAKLGHQVTVFTPWYNKKDQEFNSNDFQVKRLFPWAKFGNGAFLPQLIGQLGDFDIVHLHYPFFGAAEIIWLLKILKRKKIKLVITYHMDVVGALLMKPFFKFHTKFITPLIIKAADKVIVTSLDYAQTSNIKEFLASEPNKFIAIPPSVDLEKFFPSKKEKQILYQHNLNPETDKVLLFVGALDKAHYFKGIDFLINSFNVLDHSGCADCGYKIKLVIVGSGNLKNKYEQQVQNAGLQDKILFAGYVSDEDLPKYYNIADVVVLPSIDRSEAFGITLIEAMACAKPVVAANLAGVRSVFTNKEEGYVFEVMQEGDLANRINKLFTNNQLAEKMGQQARLKAVNAYSHEYLLKKLEDVYINIGK